MADQRIRGSLPTMDFDDETPAMLDKVRPFASLTALLAKLEGKAAMWERVARENKERAEDFERAAQAIRDGATSVTVGRTTYTLSSERE